MAQTGYTPILIYSSTTASQAPAAGNLTNSALGSELAINITDGKLFYKDNANAVQVIGWKTTPTTAGGTGLTSYAAGDLLYYATGTTLSKLAIGASTTILTSSGSAPQWSAASGITVGTATNLAGGAGGSVPYQSAAGTTAMLAIGTAYYMLGVNAGGTAPSWQPSATSVLTTQGDLLYASAANTLARLAKNTTATRYLSNTGTSNNPAWAQIDLSNGVTGTLPVANGGTGATTFTAGQILFGNTTSAINTSSNLYWDNTNFRLSLGKGTSPSYNIDILQATAPGMRMATTSAVSSNATLYFDIANNFSGISQSFVQGIGPGSSGVSQLSFGVSLTAAATTATDVARFDTGGNFRPSADNTYSNGTGALRWSVIYAATGTINTSDGTTKTVLGSIDDAEKRVAQRIKAGIKKFKFNDAIAIKGDSARIHWGVVAQDVQAAFAAENLNAEQYGLFCSDSWFEKNGEKVLDDVGEIKRDGECPPGAIKVTKLGVRYEELLAFVIASM